MSLVLNNGAWFENGFFFGYAARAKEIFTSEGNRHALDAIKYIDGSKIILLDLKYFIVKGEFDKENEKDALTLFGKTVK